MEFRTEALKLAFTKPDFQEMIEYLDFQPIEFQNMNIEQAALFKLAGLLSDKQEDIIESYEPDSVYDKIYKALGSEQGYDALSEPIDFTQEL